MPKATSPAVHWNSFDDSSTPPSACTSRPRVHCTTQMHLVRGTQHYHQLRTMAAVAVVRVSSVHSCPLTPDRRAASASALPSTTSRQPRHTRRASHGGTVPSTAAANSFVDAASASAAASAATGDDETLPLPQAARPTVSSAPQRVVSDRYERLGALAAPTASQLRAATDAASSGDALRKSSVEVTGVCWRKKERNDRSSTHAACALSPVGA